MTTACPDRPGDSPQPSGSEYKQDWIYGKYPSSQASRPTPQAGTIFRYVGDQMAYRCPSLDLAPSDRTGGSNGRYDFVSYPLWTGCRLDRIPPTALFMYANIQVVPTPIITEEDGIGLNGLHYDSAHSNGDTMGHQHRGGGHYVAADGSVQWFLEPSNCSSNNWSVKSIRGATIPMSTNNIKWGYFESQ